MKRIALVLAIVLIITSASLLLFACTQKVADKTYEYYLCKIETTGISKTVSDEAFHQAQEVFLNAEITFTSDGKIVRKKDNSETVLGYYVQQGKGIYVSNTEDVKTDGDPDITFSKKPKGRLYWTITTTVMSETVTATITLEEKK